MLPKRRLPPPSADKGTEEIAVDRRGGAVRCRMLEERRPANGGGFMGETAGDCRGQKARSQATGDRSQSQERVNMSNLIKLMQSDLWRAESSLRSGRIHRHGCNEKYTLCVIFWWLLFVATVLGYIA